MESLSLEEDIKRIFRQKKETKAIKDRILRNVKNPFEHEEEEEENYYKSVKVSNFWGKNYIEYDSNSDRNKHYQFKNILIKLVHI